MQGKLAKMRPTFRFSPADTKSLSFSKPTCGWGSASIKGARAWVGVPGTKEITVRANSNRMTAPTNVVTDCFACIFIVSTSLPRECLSVSVHVSRSELGPIPRSKPLLPIGRAVVTECSVSLDLFWSGFSILVAYLFWADASGNRRAELDRAEEFLAMPNIMIRQHTPC